MYMKKVIYILISICSIVIVLVVGGWFDSNNNKIDNSQLIKTADNQKINKYSAAYITNGTIELYDNGERTKSESIIFKYSNEPMIFEAASNGKLIASYISLKLVQEEKINLDDKIVDYLDKKYITDDERFSQITIRDLLRHSAGFSPSYEIMIDKKIYYEPGSRFSYSGVGYIYLQNIIENVTQMSFEKAAQKYVFIPLNMSNTTFENSHTVIPYMKISSLLAYVLGVWIVVFGIVFIIQLISYFFRDSINIVKIMNMSLIISAGISIIIFMKIAQRIVLPAIIICLVCLTIINFMWKKNKKFCKIELLLFLCCIIFIFFSKIEVPIGEQITNQSANAAYTLKTTNTDMGKFIVKIIDEYDNGNMLVKEMSKDEIKIDDYDGWGLGFGVSRNNDKKIAWHTGINFGMQSLVAINFEEKSAVVILTNSDSGLEFAKNISNEKLGVNCEYEIPRNTLTN